MAKSLGNFYTIEDVMKRGYTGREIRYALLRVNYRMPLNFTWSGMDEARESLNRIDDWLERLRSIAQGASPSESEVAPSEDFEKALDNDLNISAALAVLFENIRLTNGLMDTSALSAAGAAGWLSWWNRINQVLQLSPEASAIPAEVIALADER